MSRLEEGKESEREAEGSSRTIGKPKREGERFLAAQMAIEPEIELRWLPWLWRPAGDGGGGNAETLLMGFLALVPKSACSVD